MLKFLWNNYSISYEGLLEKARKVQISVNRLRTLCAEIYEIINQLNPEFKNNAFNAMENKTK